jgi:hypothetical protein
VVEDGTGVDEEGVFDEVVDFVLENNIRSLVRDGMQKSLTGS